MKKRVLSLILAVLMVLSVMPVMTLSILGADEEEAATEINYDDLYVKTGLIGWFKAEDVVNKEQPRQDALGNSIWIYNSSYDETDGTLATGQVYFSGILDKVDGVSDKKATADYTVETVMKYTASGALSRKFVVAGPYAVMTYDAFGTFRHIFSSWSPRGAVNNTVTWDVYEKSPMYSGTNPWAEDSTRMFSFTLKNDITLKEYKYDPTAGQYQDAEGNAMYMHKDSASRYISVFSEILNGTLYRKYLVNKDANVNLPESYKDLKRFDETTKTYVLDAAAHNTFSTFSNYVSSAGVLDETGVAATVVENDNAKVIPAIVDDLPFDGTMELYEYVDGQRVYAVRNNVNMHTIPFTYGSYGDDFNEDGTNKNETIWDGKLFATGRANSAADVAVGEAYMKPYQVRIYSRLITDAEMAQNHFVDIAKYKTLDKNALAVLLTLPAEAQAEVHAAFKDIVVATELTTDELNEMLYKAISAAYIVRYDAVSEAEVAFKDFATAEICTVENVYQLNLLAYIELPTLNKDLVNAKIELGDESVADAAEAQAYLDTLFAAYAFDYSDYETAPERFKDALYEIYLEATSQEAIDNAETVYAGIDFAEFDTLSDDLQATVEEAMASDMAALKALAIAGDLEGAQTWLDEKISAAADAVYSDYDALYVKDGLYSHINFLETSKNELSGEDLATWKNIMAAGESYADKGANAILQRYVKVNTAEENYTFGGGYGVYYKTVDGSYATEATAANPAVFENSAISSVRGNTFQFGEGYIVSPVHSIGYYSADSGATTTLFDSYNAKASLSVGSTTAASQMMHTWLNLPDIDTTADHTLQIAASFLHLNDTAAAAITNYNYQAGLRNSQPFMASFFTLTLNYWASGYSATSNISFPLTMQIREVVDGAWVAQGANRVINLPGAVTNTYKIGNVSKMPATYTMVSDVVTKTISAGDQVYENSQSSYAAKADAKFYYNSDLLYGTETFGTMHGDDLLWIAGGDPCSDDDNIGNKGGVAIYAVRIYDRTLSEAEINQNRFADIATFYHLNLKNYYAMDEDDRADAIDAFLGSLTQPDFAYETTGSGKNRTSSAVVALYEAAFPAEKALTYLDFYSYDGLTSMITFYEATAENNTAAWRNMMASGEAYADKGANAILQSYVKVGTKSDYTLNTYGLYYKTVGGNYVLYPTQDDPASATADKVLEGARGNTLEFHDGYILSPWHCMGYYKVGDADAVKFTAQTAVKIDGVNGAAPQLMNTSMNLPQIDQTKDVTVQYVMSLHNRSTSEITDYNYDQATRGGDVINNAFFTLQTGSWYSNASKLEMQYYFQVRNEKGTGTWAKNSLATHKASTTLKQNEDHVPGTAATFTFWSDVVSTDIATDDQKASGSDKYVAKANVKLFYNGSVMLDDSYFDPTHNDGYTWIGAEKANAGSNIGIRGGAAIYAVRTYDRAITEAEMIQNQFADVVGYFHVDPAVMSEIPESAWAQVYPIFKDIKLTDTTVTKEALEAQLAEKVKEVSGNGAVGLIEFEGYQARNLEYNGLRALYTVNEELLSELEAEGYEVEFGAILAIADGRTADEIVGSVVDGDFKVSVGKAQKVEVYDNGEYTGKTIVNKTTGEKQFACTITFKGASAAAANYQSDLIFRSYAVVTKGGVSTVVYPDNSSKLFDDALNLKTVANAYFEAGQGYYKLIQDVLGDCGVIAGVGETEYTINGNNLADYTIIPSGDTMKFALELRAAIKTATGYELPIAQETTHAGLALYIGHNPSVHADGLWEVTFEGTTVSMKGHGVAETKAAVDAFVALLDGVNTEIPTENNLVPDVEVALAGYTVIYAEDLESSANTLAAAVNTACGETLAVVTLGTAVDGRSITISALNPEKYFDDAYKISISAEGDIVIEAGTVAMVDEAVALLTGLLTETGITMNANGYTKKHAYAQADLTVNGTAIDEYSIVANTDYYGSKLAAEYLQEEIEVRTGHKLPIVESTAGAAIVVDETTNDNGVYNIGVSGSTLTLSGAGASGAYTAAKKLVAQIGDNTEVSVAASSGAMFTLNNTKKKIADGELKFAMWGDSVGEASGLIAPAVRLQEKLAADYTSATIDMINPSLGGRNTAWGVYYIDESILDVGNTDLVMISLGTNDSPYGLGYAESALNYQSMIEKIRRANPNADIVFLMYGRIHEVKNMVTGGDVQFMRAMFDIADHYNIPIVDTTYKMDVLTGASENSDSTTNTDWQYYYQDTVHPNQIGYDLYADIFYQSIKAAIDAADGSELVAHEMPERIYENSKINGKRYYGANAESVAAINVDYETGNWIGKEDAKNGWTYTIGSSVTFDFEGIGVELYTTTNRTYPPEILVEVFDEAGEKLFEKTQICDYDYYWPIATDLAAGNYSVKVTVVDMDETVGFRIVDFSIIGDPNK